MFTAPLCEPSWALPAALIAFGVLLVWLGLLGWASSRRRILVDPHGEAYGDVPRVPS